MQMLVNSIEAVSVTVPCPRTLLRNRWSHSWWTTGRARRLWRL